MGPLADRTATVFDATIGNFVQYAKDERTNAGRELVRVARQNTPGALAPWYVRLAYERWLLDRLQAHVDPEFYSSVRSRIRNTKKLSGNDFWFPPGGSPRAPNFGAAIGAN
jgi:hypothetical protein